MLGNFPSFSLEEEIKSKHKVSSIAGVDEVGCGPWAGPVVACAFIFLHYDLPILNQINDSKKLSLNKRQIISDYFWQVKGKIVDFALGVASVKEIDCLNIGGATRLAMQRAVNDLPAPPQFLLIDGIRKPELSHNILMIKKGDQISFSIAAASIIAKVYRDHLMGQLDQEYPQYGWVNNAGYGTVLHNQAITDFGITPHHRASYAPIKRYLESQN